MRPNRFFNDLDTSESIKWLTETAEKKSSESFVVNKIAECDGREDIRRSYYASSVRLSLDLLRALYARGDSIESMRSTYKLTRERLHLLEQCIVALNLQKEKNGLYSLVNMSMLIALGTALGESRSAIGSDTRYSINANYDLFTDRLLSIYDPERPMSDEMENRSVYGKLYEVFDAPPDQRPAMIARYLDTWGKLLVKNHIPSYLYPVPDNLLKEWAGFWCYPAAAVVAALNIDDSSFIDHEFYPGDLMREAAKYRGEPVILPPVKNGPLPAAPKPAPRRKKAPASLAPWEGLFNQMASALPKGLQNLLWNGLIEVLDNAGMLSEEGELDPNDFIRALAEAQWEVDLLSQYRRLVLLHVDWKDAESALSFCADLARTAGIKDDFSPDVTAMENPHSVEEVFTLFNQWLKKRKYQLLSPDTGDDAYFALISKAKDAEPLAQALEGAGVELQTFLD